MVGHVEGEFVVFEPLLLAEAQLFDLIITSVEQRRLIRELW
jgi:hypothetical protein